MLDPAFFNNARPHTIDRSVQYHTRIRESVRGCDCPHSDGARGGTSTESWCVVIIG